MTNTTETEVPEVPEDEITAKELLAEPKTKTEQPATEAKVQEMDEKPESETAAATTDPLFDKRDARNSVSFMIGGAIALGLSQATQTLGVIAYRTVNAATALAIVAGGMHLFDQLQNNNLEFRTATVVGPATKNDVKKPAGLTKLQKCQISGTQRFGYDSSLIEPETQSPCIALVSAWARKDINNRTIILNGFASPAGSERYNDRLANERALSVKHRFMEFGVDPGQIQITSNGEKGKALTAPGDNYFDPHQRVVTIRTHQWSPR